MKNRKILVVLLLAICSSVLIANKSTTSDTAEPSPIDKADLLNAVNMFDQGRQVFRFETFDDQTFWGEALNFIRQSRERNSAVSGLA